MEQDHFRVDSIHVAVPRAAGIDFHKMDLTASVHLCSPDYPVGAMATCKLCTAPPKLRASAHSANCASSAATGTSSSSHGPGCITASRRCSTADLAFEFRIEGCAGERFRTTKRTLRFLSSECAPGMTAGKALSLLLANAFGRLYDIVRERVAAAGAIRSDSFDELVSSVGYLRVDGRGHGWTRIRRIHVPRFRSRGCPLTC